MLKELIKAKNKIFITSQRLNADLRREPGEVSGLNRTIRTMETYDELVTGGHIIELEWGLHGRDADFASLIMSNSYNPVMLIDAVAQKAIEHHLVETAAQAVGSARENAVLDRAGIRMDLIAQDPSLLLLLRTLSESKAAKLKAEEATRRVNALETRVQRMDGDSGYATIRGYARLAGLSLSERAAANAGKTASKWCRAQNLEIGKVPDERHGHVNSYPKAILKRVFDLEEDLYDD